MGPAFGGRVHEPEPRAPRLPRDGGLVLRRQARLFEPDLRRRRHLHRIRGRADGSDASRDPRLHVRTEPWRRADSRDRRGALGSLSGLHGGRRTRRMHGADAPLTGDSTSRTAPRGGSHRGRRDRAGGRSRHRTRRGRSEMIRPRAASSSSSSTTPHPRGLDGVLTPPDPPASRAGGDRLRLRGRPRPRQTVPPWAGPRRPARIRGITTDNPRYEDPGSSTRSIQGLEETVTRRWSRPAPLSGSPVPLPPAMWSDRGKGLETGRRSPRIRAVRRSGCRGA